MRGKGEKGSLHSSAMFVGLWQLCHPLKPVSKSLFSRSVLEVLRAGSPWQLGGSLTSSRGSDKEWSFLGRLPPSSRCIRQWEMCVPIPFVPRACLFLGGLTWWHKGSRRGLILPGQLRSISWLGETFRRRQDSCFWKSLPPWHAGSTWKEWESSFPGSTHRPLAAPNPCQIPSRQLFVFFLDTCRYETTSELTREGP